MWMAAVVMTSTAGTSAMSRAADEACGPSVSLRTPGEAPASGLGDSVLTLVALQIDWPSMPAG